MKSDTTSTVEALSETERIATDAVRDALQLHRKLGVPAVVVEDAKIVEVLPDEIPDVPAAERHCD